MKQGSDGKRLGILGLVIATALALGAPAFAASGKATTACSVTVSGSHTSYGTLQDAVRAASSGDTLTVHGTCYGNSAISGLDLTIAGHGDATLDAAGQGSVLWIGTATVTIRGVTITNGSRTNGGGIYNEGNLTLRGTSVTGNVATNDGGGIYNTGTLSLGNTDVTGNSAAAFGGGIYNLGTLSVGGGSHVTGNQPDDIYQGP